MISLLTTLALFAAAPIVTPDPVAAPASVTVQYRDLNLHTAAGRTELDRRLAHAVRAVCPAPDHRELRQVQAAEACRTVALRAANGQREVALASAGEAIQIGSNGR